MKSKALVYAWSLEELIYEALAISKGDDDTFLHEDGVGDLLREDGTFLLRESESNVAIIPISHNIYERKYIR